MPKIISFHETFFMRLKFKKKKLECKQNCSYHSKLSKVDTNCFYQTDRRDQKILSKYLLE